MKAVLISIKPKWCELIASGKKILEVRKTRPKQQTPFKCYIYCTKGHFHKEYSDTAKAWKENALGKVIGEFVCDKIFEITTDFNVHDELPGSPVETWLTWEEAPEEYDTTEALEKATCLSLDEISSYMGAADCAYGWHISDLKIYEKPKELAEFYKPGTLSNADFEYQLYDGSGDPRRRSYASYLFTQAIRRPPQSWCYVEEVSADG